MEVIYLFAGILIGWIIVSYLSKNKTKQLVESNENREQKYQKIESKLVQEKKELEENVRQNLVDLKRLKEKKDELEDKLENVIDTLDDLKKTNTNLRFEIEDKVLRLKEYSELYELRKKEVEDLTNRLNIDGK